MAAITDLAAASSVAATDNLVINQGGTDRRVTADKFAVLGLANTFTADVTLSKANPTIGAAPTSGAAALSAGRGDNGANSGSFVFVGRNSNASTPAAGRLFMETLSSSRHLWVDNTGLLRIHTSAPTNATDTAGTVVGAQTSSKDAKTQRGKPEDAAAILAHIAEGAKAVRRFVYKNGAFGGEEFSGIVVDYAPRYGMDRDADHPAGKSLNVPNAIGDLMIAVDYLARRVAALEANHA